jgi:5-bromo-4-chloroindolyl phosphate hydrolysis protein
MKKLKLWLGILCVFILGAIAGASGFGLYRQYMVKKFLRGNSDSIARRIMERYDRELDLTREQYASIEKIVEESRRKWEELRRKYQPEKDLILDRRRDRIVEYLDPEQQGKFEEMHERDKEKGHRFPHPR